MSSSESQFFSWARLLRVANLPSAISNILMGYLLVHHTWTPTMPLILLVLASAAIYMAGMVLNDAFDFKIDLAQRPSRPLPAGQISIKAAWLAGFGLLLAGVVFAGVAGWISSPQSSFGLNRTLIIAVVLAVLVVLYDGPLKRTYLAPFLMGGCRTANILLGASTFAAATTVTATATGSSPFFQADLIWGLPLLVWWVAISIGFLISGATLLGRNEAAETQSRTPMIVAAVIVALSLVSLATCVYCPVSERLAQFQIHQPQKTVFPLFVGFMAISILRRVIEAVVSLKPKSIQMGVVSVLRSLIILDAGICYLAVPDQVIYAIAVLCLLAPTMLLGRYMAST